MNEELRGQNKMIMREILKISNENASLNIKLLDMEDKLNSIIEANKDRTLNNCNQSSEQINIEEDKCPAFEEKDKKIGGISVKKVPEELDIAPWVEFRDYTFKMMDEQDKNIVRSQLRKARYSWPLAFYFYRHIFTWDNIDANDWTNVYHQHVEEDVMDFTKIRATLEAIDKQDGQTRRYLYQKYNILRKIAKVSFGFEDHQIPNVKFTSTKGKVYQKNDPISFDGMNQAYETLTENGKLIEALAVKLIWRYLMKPSDFYYLKFDDIYQKDRQYFINIPSNKRRGSRKERITKDLMQNS